MQFKMKESNASKELYESLPALRLFSTDRIKKTDYYTSKDGWVQAEKGVAALIDQWRKDFRDDDLPFAIVQIADCNKRNGEGWKLIQQAQAEIGKERPFVETVRSVDICETNDIHPPTKQLLAERIFLALQKLQS